jgi:hypothetical protein
MSARRRRAISSILVAVAAGTLRGSTARAVDKFYVGPTAGFWDTSTNWNPAGQPAPGDNVLVSSSLLSPSITVTADSITPPTSTNLAQLIIDSPSVFGITVNQTGTRISEVNGYVGYTNGGVLDLSGTASHSVSLSLYFGDLSGSRGFGTLGGSAGLTVGFGEWIGYGGNAIFTQSGGSNAATIFVVGELAGSTGTMTLSGGLLSSSIGSTIGDVGQGTFNQSSGTHNASAMTIGSAQFSVGHYSMTNGILIVAHDMVVGDAGFGTFNQNAGATEVFGNAYVARGTSGGGVFSVFGGKDQVTGSLLVGYNGSATFTLGGVGDLEVFGANTNVISGLVFGYSNNARGDGVMSSGTLTAQTEIVGAYSLGTFTQSGGDHSGMQLTVGLDGAGRGTMTLSGGSLIFSRADIAYLAPGDFIQTGGTFTASSAVFVGEFARGTYSMTNGTLSAFNLTIGQGGGTGLFVQNGGSVSATNLQIGASTTTISRYSLTNGTLLAGNEIVAAVGPATFNQVGGSHTVSGAMYLGFTAASAGTFTLGGGTLLISGTQYVGYSGLGNYVQSGGDNHVAGTGLSGLYFGYNAGATGAGSLSAGTLRVDSFEVIGKLGTGTFLQTGGTHSAGLLFIGDSVVGNGTCTLNGGSLQVAGSIDVGNQGPGAFNQSGGTVTAQGFAVGDSATGNGTANISSGASILLSLSGIVGSAGTGVLNQSGGTISSPDLRIGALAGGSGTYALSGGTLSVTGTTTVSAAGRGTFNLSGGLHTTGGLTIGSTGVYTQTGGTVNAGAALNNGSFTQIAGQAFLGTVTGGTGTMTLGVASGNASKTTVNTLVQPTVIVNNTGFLQFTIFPGPALPHHTNTITSLAISGTGRVDLANQDLLTSTPAATIRSYLLHAYTPSGDWSGTGLNSVFAMTSSIKYTVGYADGNDLSSNDARPDVPAGKVLVRPTLVGDANLDGKVDFFDITQVLGYKYNTGVPASYTDGDLNYDGVVDFFDLTVVLSANYNSGAVFGLAAAASADAPDAVPEPVGIGVLGIGGAAGLLSRRRRRRYFVASDTFTRGSRAGASLPPSPPVLTATPSAMRSPGLAMICSSPSRPETTSTVVP